MTNKKPLKCPFCKQVLTVGEKQRYETLIDHVCNPNRENYPLRETFVCTCQESNYGFWDDWGDWYCREYRGYRGTKRSTSAINSGSWKYDKEYSRRKTMQKYVIGRFVFEIYRVFRNWIWKIKSRTRT